MRSGSLLEQGEQPRKARKIVRKKSTDDMVDQTLRENFCDMRPEEEARPSTSVMILMCACKETRAHASEARQKTLSHATQSPQHDATINKAPYK